MVGATLAVVLAASSGACAMLEVNAIGLQSREIRIRDVATLECIADQDAKRVIGSLTIATFPEDRVHIELPRSSVATLVRRRVPALSALAMSSPNATVSFNRPPPAGPARTRNCYAALHSIAAGESITSADIEQTPCRTDARPARAAYDRIYGVLRARDDIAAEAYMGPLAATDSYSDTGDAVVLVTTQGAARITRQVELLQPARRGAVFVRDVDGNVFSAPFNPAARP